MMSGQQTVDYTVSIAERGVERGGIFAAGFGEIGPASALAANFLRDGTNDFACLNAAGEIFSDTHDQRHIAVRSRTEHHNARANLITKLIHQSTHLRAIEIVHAV